MVRVNLVLENNCVRLFKLLVKIKGNFQKSKSLKISYFNAPNKLYLLEIG